MVRTRQQGVRAAADALVSNVDCFQSVAEHVLLLHHLPTYASWRLASSACLMAWRSSFYQSEPWLHVWPPKLDYAIARHRTREEFVTSVRKTRQNKEIFEHVEKFAICEGDACWAALVSRLDARRKSAEAVLDTTLAGARPMAIPTLEDLDRFLVGAFRLHVVIELVAEYSPAPLVMFAGTAQLGTPVEIEGPDGFDHPLLKGVYRVRNGLRLRDTDACTLFSRFEDEEDAEEAREDEVAPAALQEHFVYGVDVRASLYVSRSDGAVACLARRLDGYLDDGVGDSGISSEHDRYDDDTCAHIYVNVYYVYACTCTWGQVRLRRRLLPA